MDAATQEFAKYGAFALLAILVIYVLFRACVFLFKKYDEAQAKNIALSERMLVTMSANTLAMQANTQATVALGELIRSRAK